MSPIFITLFMQINGNIQGITVMNLVIGCTNMVQRTLFLIAANRYPLNQQDKIKICWCLISRVCQIEIMFHYIPGSHVKFSPWGLWMKCDYYFWDIFLFRPCPRYSKFNMGFKWENLEISQNPPRGWNIGFIMLFQTPLHSLGSKMGG